MTSVPRIVFAALAISLLLAGCMGNVVTISGQGYAAGTKTKHLDCGATGQISQGSQGSGKLSVTVLDGDDNQVYYNGDFGAGQNGASHTVDGVPGEWTLKVSTGFGYAGQWAVTLSC